MAEARGKDDTGRAPVLLPVLGASRGAPARDLARGGRGLLLWGGPILTILAGSALVSSGWVSVVDAGLMLVLGTAWLGVTCLVNGLRCGRVHCLIDGTLLPALAFVGVLDLAGVVALPWDAYGGFLWLIVLASFAAEWVAGPYVHRAALRG